VGLEFLRYRELVIATTKAQWVNAIGAPGLVASVRFNIGRDGRVSSARLAQRSGNPAYDQTALSAVLRVNRLPPPPAQYVDVFREFEIRFNSNEVQ
jgi:TonB family protein